MRLRCDVGPDAGNQPVIAGFTKGAAFGMSAPERRPELRLNHLERSPAFEQLIPDSVQALRVVVRKHDIGVPVIAQRRDDSRNIRGAGAAGERSHSHGNACRCLLAGVVVETDVHRIAGRALPVGGQGD